MIIAEFKFKFILALKQFEVQFNQTPTEVEISWEAMSLIAPIGKDHISERLSIPSGINIIYVGATSKDIVSLRNGTNVLDFM